jgi:hypothetical protein
MMCEAVKILIAIYKVVEEQIFFVANEWMVIYTPLYRMEMVLFVHECCRGVFGG